MEPTGLASKALGHVDGVSFWLYLDSREAKALLAHQVFAFWV